MPEEKKSLYAPFLLVMLILSSIVTSFMIIGLVVGVINFVFSTAVVVDSVESASVMRGVVAFGQVLIAVGSAVALALLWMRKKEGLILKMILLAFSSLVSVLAVNYSYGFSGLVEGSTVRLVILMIGILAVLWNGGIATLWYFAWRAQEKYDGIGKFLGSKKVD